MQTGGDLKNFVEWDVRNWSSALDFWLQNTSQDITACSALELGSRNGGLSLWLALKGSRVLCSDISPPAAEASQLHVSRGVSHLVRYQAIDATNIPYTMKFDVVMFKSMLGAIGRMGGKRLQAQAVNQMHKALKDGGELFFAENLVGFSMHQFLRKNFVTWGKTWRYISVAEMEEFLAHFSSVRYQTVGFAGALGRSEVQRDLLGMLDQRIFNHIVPEHWRYIIVGIAKK